MASIRGFFRVLVALWRFGEALAPLLEQLPNMLPVAGQAMVTSGEGAIAVSKSLKSQDGYPVNAQSLVNGVGESVRVSRDAVNDAVTQVSDAANLLNAVKVPTISAQTTDINLGLTTIKVVTGINVGMDSPFWPVRDSLQQTANLLGGVRDQLNLTYTAIQQLCQALGTAGADLEVLGNALKQSGDVLRSA